MDLLIFDVKKLNMLFLRDIIRKKTVCIGVYSSMQKQSCLYFGATQQSRSYQWMIGCRQLLSTDKNAEQLPLTRKSLIRPFTTLLHCADAAPFQLNIYSVYPLFAAVRFRKRRMNRKSESQDTEYEVIWVDLTLVAALQ